MRLFNIVGFCIIMFILVVLTGCGSNVGERAAEYNFKQGVAELQLSFLENAPPKSIYPFSEFKMVIKLDNQAAYDVTDGVIRVIGLDEQYLEIEPTEQSFKTLVGRSLTSPSGEADFLEFDGGSNGLFQNAEKYEGNYFLVVNYHSTMDFADTICINPSMYDVYDSGCKVEGEKSYAGQGAPLVVKEIEEIIFPGEGAEVEFRVRLKNQGKGSVGFVNLKQAELGGEELVCKFQGKGAAGNTISLKENEQEAVLVCKKFLIEQKSYTTTLSLKFSYDYELKESKKLILVK